MSHDPATTRHAHDALRDPHAHLAVALVLSLLLWAPFGAAVLRSDLDVVAAGVRYLVAFVGCRLAVGGIAHLAASYHLTHPAETPEVALAATAPRRRATDEA